MASGFKMQNNVTEEINLVKVLNLFRKNWYFLIIALVLSLIGCKLYLRYAPPSYLASATIRIEEEQNPTQGLGLLESLGNFSSNIQSEIRMLRSRSLVMRALKVMDIQAKYYLVGTIVTAEMHRDDTPFVVTYDTTGNIMYNRTISMFFLGGNKFRLQMADDGSPVEGVYYFGEEVDINGFKFKIIRRDTPRYRLTPGLEYRWEAVPWDGLLGRAQSGLRVEQTGHLVPILRISCEDQVPKFTAELINTLLEVYKLQDIEIRQQAAKQQLEFIRSQVDTIKVSVEKAERILQSFKRDNKFFSVEQQLTKDLEEIKANELKLNEYRVALRQVKRLETEMNGINSVLSLPFSLEGNDDPILFALINSYNEIVKEKLTALQSYQPTHPRVVEMDSKLEEFRNAIGESIKSIKGKIESNLTYYESLLATSETALLGIPETQRQYLSLTREYEVQEKILSTLLEKQAEAQIAKASIVSPVRIVDRALVPLAAVSPNHRNVYIIGGGLGFCLGILVILLTGMLNTTLTYREEIENTSLTPVIGVVRKSSKSINQKFPKLIVNESPKSSLAESIRAIRTNLQFISPDKDTKIIAITSTVSGEGKSFITINLGGIISMLDLKVVILDMDLRKPKLHYSFDDDNTRGVSTYLVGKSTLDEVLLPTPVDNLQIITSGPIPPNPAELVQSPRMQELLDKLAERYDYILIDTPPIGLVTDGATLIKKSDISLYVIRAEYSKRSFATLPDQLVDEHQIKNMYIVFNSVSASGRRYGGYGYKVYSYGGYYSDDPVQEPWWKFWKHIKFFKRIRKRLRKK